MIDLASLTPKQIVFELDKYIIGQKDAKKNVAIALRNRWRRMNAPEEMQKEITPNNILMIGSTGVGKTEIARRLAKLANAPFIKVEASKFTEVGYVGRDVESMVRDLVEASVHMVQLERKEKVKEKALLAVEEVILEALIPSLKKESKKTKQKEEENPKEISQEDIELNHKTRELFREKLRNKEIEDKKIDILIKQPNSPNIGVMGVPMDEMAMMNITDMIDGMMPKANKKKKVSIADARKHLYEIEAAKLIDMDEVKSEAIKKAEDLGVIFIDEIDKIASGKGNGGNNGQVSREGVQRDLLPIVEGSTVNTKHGVINTDHILFIAAGAFHFSKPSDLIPELQGRFPIRVELQSLVEADFYKILKEPQGALTKQYKALLASENVSLDFDDEALLEIARIAFAVNAEMENIGARRLQTVMSQLLNDIMFDIPDDIQPNQSITISKQNVIEKLGDLVKNKDLSQYIL
ncbi:MAG: ATP-dependent protease ATPase subunit HslU [Pseudarcicella sp.]|nr:ATP-dependent protease ATPase subunit HslU [Pseudarcicella sp.]MBP6410843.1 ATP-dependent protease ATPase subunit HslU [Pseudarcicella sp.]